MSVESMLAQINNKVGYLIRQAEKAADGETAVGNVDFIVDMFDRDDADSLGDYWNSTSGFSLRGGVCLPNSPSTSSAMSTVGKANLNLISSASSSSGAVASYTGQKDYKLYLQSCAPNSSHFTARETSLSNRYKAGISSKDYKCKIVFDVFPPINIEDSADRHEIKMAVSEFGMSIYANDAATRYRLSACCFSPGRDITQPNMACSSTLGGVTVSASAGGKLLLQNKVNHSLRLYLNDGTSIFNDLGYESGNYADESNQETTVSGVSIFARVIINTGITPILQKFSFQDIFSVGENKVELTVSGSRIVLNCNGIELFDVLSQYIVDRKYVGIDFPAINGLGILQNFGVKIGIKSFKAWRTDMPEPPDESGHGNYDPALGPALNYQYSDKYHSRIYEEYIENGRVKRRHVGYSYDPNGA